MSAAPTSTARCPRCGSDFHCGVNDSEPCACSTLSLSDELLTALRERWDGCLCLACLGELSQGSLLASHQTLVTRP